MTPQVTVAIPTFRRPALLQLCLESVLGQTLHDIEVFVSDNGADAETASVVASFGDPRVNYVPLESNVGSHGNLTRCLGLGTAEYTAILQDDDLLQPTSLERRLQRIAGDPRIVIVNTAHSVIDAAGTVVRSNVNWSLARGDWEIEANEFIRRSLSHGVFFHISTTLLRRSAVAGEVFEPVGGYNDLAVWLRVASRGGRIAYIDEPLTAVREHVLSESTRRGLHTYAKNEHRDGEIDTQTFEQVRQMQLVRRRFLESEGWRLPGREQLWLAARRDARKRLARIIVKDALEKGDVRHTARLLREAAVAEPSMRVSLWAPLAICAAAARRPAAYAVRRLVDRRNNRH
jgi:GT2 family glycosyltransferase